VQNFINNDSEVGERNQLMLKGVVSNLLCLLNLISEQSPQEPNPLYRLGRIPQQMATPSEQ
jgi:hypothetical protein